MKQEKKNISTPDELERNLRYNSPFTWATLSLVLVLLIGFFAWASIYKIKVKASGVAEINNNAVTLRVDKAKVSELEPGQKVYIANMEGEILSIVDNVPVVSSFALADGKYDYYIVLKEMRPIEFLFR